MTDNVTRFPALEVPPAELHRGHTELSKDDRPITSAIGERGNFGVGELGVTKIVAYDEYGDQAFIPWLAIFKGDSIAIRCPARDMTISYETGF